MQIIFRIFKLSISNLRTMSVSHQLWLWPCRSMLHDTNWTLCICTAPGEQWSHMGSTGHTKNLLSATHSRLMYELISNRLFPVKCFSVFTYIFCPSLVLLERFISVSFYTAYLCPLAVSHNYLYGFHLSRVLLCMSMRYPLPFLVCHAFWCSFAFSVFCLIFVIFCLCCFWTKSRFQSLASSYIL